MCFWERDIGHHFHRTGRKSGMVANRLGSAVLSSVNPLALRTQAANLVMRQESSRANCDKTGTFTVCKCYNPVGGREILHY